MENYSAELNSLMNRAPHGFMQLKLWDLFFPFYLLLCFERDGKMIFLFIILVSICRIKRNPLVFVAFNSVMPESGSSIQPEHPPSWVRIHAGHLSIPSVSSQGLG